MNTKNPKASMALERAPDPWPQWGSLCYVGKFHGSGPGAPPDQILDPHLRHVGAIATGYVSCFELVLVENPSFTRLRKGQISGGAGHMFSR